nr:hypothetical protein SHINE37_70085 [Rhizobiaceae bacterium]
MGRLHGGQPEPLSSLSTRHRRSAPLSLSLRRRAFPISGRLRHRAGLESGALRGRMKKFQDKFNGMTYRLRRSGTRRFGAWKPL